MMTKQPDSFPTNKLAVGSSVSTVFAMQAGPIIEEIWPQVAPVVLAGPTVTTSLAALVAIFAGWAVAWFIPDRPQAF